MTPPTVKSKTQALVDGAWPHIAKVFDAVNNEPLSAMVKTFAEVREVPASTCVVWRDVQRDDDGEDWTYTGVPLPMRHLHKRRGLDEDDLRAIERDGGAATALATVRGYLDAAKDKGPKWVLDALQGKRPPLSGGLTAAVVAQAVEHISDDCNLVGPQCTLVLTANRRLESQVDVAVRRHLNGGNVVRMRPRCGDGAIGIVVLTESPCVHLHQAMPFSLSWQPRADGDGIRLVADERLAVAIVREEGLVRIVP
jgi:hypothetical protein